MGKALLRLFSVETLIAIVTELLAETVRNPQSDKARALRGYVVKLHEATGNFLSRVYVD